MAALSMVIGTILTNLTLAKSEADKASARLGEIYAQDNKLQYFSVPYLDIKTVEIEVKFAFSQISAENNENEVLFLHEDLKMISPENLSSLKFSTTFTHISPKKK